jgi:hypothetical protein
MRENLKPFDVFICYKISSGKDFAEHLKAGMEELGLHSFLSSKDLPQMVDGKEEWENIRNRALEESKTFILIITPGFDLSREVRNELSLARKLGNKEFIYFRHRDLERKIIVDLSTEKVDFGRQQQVSFETKEELLRLAHKILIKNQSCRASISLKPTIVGEEKPVEGKSIQAPATKNNTELMCAMCSKHINGEPHVEVFNGEAFNFDCQECAQVYRKLKSVYGENIE